MDKYDSCEHCNKSRNDGECLSAVEYWYIAEWNGHRMLSYHLVCDACYESRREWCVDPLPENCEKCGAAIGVEEHCFEGKYNRDGKEIASDGLTPGETCRVICKGCAGEAHQ